jgi:hypothetical protein
MRFYRKIGEITLVKMHPSTVLIKLLIRALTKSPDVSTPGLFLFCKKVVYQGGHHGGYFTVFIR